MQIILSNEYGKKSSSKYGDSKKLFEFGATFFIMIWRNRWQNKNRAIFRERVGEKRIDRGIFDLKS